MRLPPMRCLAVALSALAALAAGVALAGADPACHWPRFHGPDLTNRSPATGLLKEWPDGGPPLVWRVGDLGHGYSGVTIADGLIYTTGNVGRDTLITAITLDGQVAWRVANGPAYTRSHPGTRSTPTIDDGRLYHENADGDLVCLEARTGKPVWHVNILREFHGRNISWALAESVLVDGDRVICTPGGKEIGLVALDKHTGKTVWTCRGTDDKPGYCTPILIEYKGLRQIVTLMASSVVGVHADTGRLLWQVRHETLFDENITVPIFHDGYVFIVSRTTGSRLFRLKVTGQDCSVEEVWASKALDVQHEGVLLLDGHLYGCSMTARPGPWVCLDFATGKTCWTDAGIGRASVTWADGRIYTVSHGGTVGLVIPSPEAFRLVSRFDLPKGGQGPVWAHPVVCGGRLYLRHDETLFCYDVSAR